MVRFQNNSFPLKVAKNLSRICKKYIKIASSDWTRNVAPLFGSLTLPLYLPPWASMICLTISKTIPTPWGFRWPASGAQ